MRFCGSCGTRLGDAAAAQMPSVLPPAGSVSTEQLGVMMGADLLQRFQKAGLEAAGQRRNVTVLFVDLTGFTVLAEQMDGEDLFELVQKYILVLVEAVYRYEGTVDKIMGDGLMALFGAPIAHENNAERAVRAALDLRADVAQLSRNLSLSLDVELKVHVGLNAGVVIVGGIGSDMLMNYTAIGDTVNLASRLEETASPGTILASENVYRATNMLFDYEVIPELNLKGISRPVTAHRLLGSKAQPGPVRGLEGMRAPLIGRERELKRLELAVQTLLRKKEGQLVMITGEAGIGKSRLTAELRSIISSQIAVTVLEGHNLAYRRAVAYWTFLDLLRKYLQVTPETPPQQVRAQLTAKVTAVMGSSANDVLPYLEHLFSLEPADPETADRLSYLEPNQLRQQIFLSVRNLLVAEARRQPLVLILEDLHWADDLSLDLLTFLVDSVRQSPLMIYAISRPFQEGPLTKIVAQAQKWFPEKFTAIQLQSLSPDQSERLLSELLTISELPTELRSQILQRAAGIPFYLEEILRMLIDRQIIRRENSHWRVVAGADFAALGVPDSLGGLILARFDRLEPFQRKILQAASVIGRQFNLSLISAVVLPAEESQINQALGLLTERAFLLQSSSAEGEYLFRHVLTSDAVYSTLLRRERSDIHTRVAEAIERLYAPHLEGQIEVLAGHYQRSNRLDRALHFLILAGQEAARAYANEQARLYYEQALALLQKVPPTLEQALQANQGLGDVLTFVGEYSAARECYQDAQKVLESEDFDRCISEYSGLYRRIGATYERQGDFDHALEYLAKSEWVMSISPAPFPIETARISNDIGWIHFRRGELDLAEKRLTDALALVENTGQYDVIASVYNRLGGVYYQKDELSKASEYVRKSLVLREQIGNLSAVARSYNNLGLLNWTRGDWNDALTSFTQSMELHTNLGDIEGTIEALSNLGLLELDRGDVEAAHHHLQKALIMAEQIGHSYNIGIIYLYLCRLHIVNEDWKAALVYGNRSLSALREIEASEDLINVNTYLGFAYLGMHDLAQARLWGERALTLANQLSGDHFSAPDENRGRVLRLFGEIACVSGDFVGAEQFLHESAEMYRAIGNRVELGRSMTTLAHLACVRGNFTEAKRLVDEARDIFQQLGANLDLRRVKTLTENLNNLGSGEGGYG